MSTHLGVRFVPVLAAMGLTLVALLVLVGLATLPASARYGSRTDQATPMPGSGVPCDPSVTRSVSPTVVEAGAVVDVRVATPVFAPPGITPTEGCRAARRSSAVNAIELLGQTAVLAACTGAARHASSVDPSGADLPPLFDAAGRTILRGRQSTGHAFTDRLNGARAAYVPGSAQPREPDQQVGPELTWSGATASKPPGGEQITYQLRMLPSAAPWRGPISTGVTLTVLANALPLGSAPAPNPLVCVHRPGHPEDCDTPPPSVTPPTETPATPVQPTAGIARFKAYLPAANRSTD